MSVNLPLGQSARGALIAVLPDINMPGMDGLQLLAEIRQRRPDLPVMMVTAYGDDERRRRARELGACEFITKPVDFDWLKARLHQLQRRGLNITAPGIRDHCLSRSCRRDSH